MHSPIFRIKIVIKDRRMKKRMEKIDVLIYGYDKEILKEQ